ncbi:hypothetical protein AB6A23_08860 [Paenibacillus tarimensis]
MGLLYKILQSLQENEAAPELPDRHSEKNESETSEGPRSLIDLLTQPVGSRLTGGQSEVGTTSYRHGGIGDVMNGLPDGKAFLL